MIIRASEILKRRQFATLQLRKLSRHPASREYPCHPRNRATGISEIEGKAAMVVASERGSERVSKSGPRASADQISPFVTCVALVLAGPVL